MIQKTTMVEILQTIRNFLFDNYLFGLEEQELSNEDSFLELGILDSTGILELIMFIETEFNIKVEDPEIIPENIDSVDNVSKFIYRKI